MFIFNNNLNMQYGKYIYLGNRNAFSLKGGMHVYLCLLLLLCFYVTSLAFNSHERSTGDWRQILPFLKKYKLKIHYIKPSKQRKKEKKVFVCLFVLLLIKAKQIFIRRLYDSFSSCTLHFFTFALST